MRTLFYRFCFCFLASGSAFFGSVVVSTNDCKAHLGECYEPIKAFQKNGMIVECPSEFGGSDLHFFASGVFPLVTGNLSTNFVELVDLIAPGEAGPLRVLCDMYHKLWDLVIKKRSFQTIQVDPNLLKSFYFLYLHVVDLFSTNRSVFVKIVNLCPMLEKLSAAYSSLGEIRPAGNDFLEKVLKLKEALPNMAALHHLTSEFFDCCWSYISSYFSKLHSYFDCLIQIEPGFRTEISQYSVELSELQKNSVTGLSAFETSIAKCTALRNFSHTEDLMLYELASRKLSLSPGAPLVIYSFNDLCPLCRQKLSAVPDNLLPPVLYISAFKLNRPEETTVDFIINKNLELSSDPAPAGLQNILQVRIPQYQMLPEDNDLDVDFEQRTCTLQQ